MREDAIALVLDLVEERAAVVTMGWSSEDIVAARKVARLTAGSPGFEHWSRVFERVIASAPAQRVAVDPFLCARALLLDADVRVIDEELVGRCPLACPDDYPDLDESFGPDDDNSDLDDVEDDDRPLRRPALLRATEAARVATALGFRLLRASEWEYVARALGTRSWIGAPNGSYGEIARAVEQLAEHPLFVPSRSRDLASNELGLWALHMGEWSSSK